MWFRLRPVDSRASWHRSRQFARREEIDAHGRDYRLLFQFEWSYADDGKFHQGLILCPPQYVRLFVARIVARQSVVAVTLPRTYRFPFQEGNLQDVLRWLPSSPIQTTISLKTVCHRSFGTLPHTESWRRLRHWFPDGRTQCMVSWIIQEIPSRKALYYEERGVA